MNLKCGIKLKHLISALHMLRRTEFCIKAAPVLTFSVKILAYTSGIGKHVCIFLK